MMFTTNREYICSAALPAAVFAMVSLTAHAEVRILGVTETLFLGENQNSADLWVEVNDAAQVRWNVATVEVHPPSAPKIEGVFMPCSPATQPHSCRDTVVGFDEAGRYSVFYRVSDANTLLPTVFYESTVYKAKTSNQAPSAVQLLAPADGGTPQTNMIFDWTAATDPEGDSLTYTLLVATNPNDFMGTLAFRKEALSHSMFGISNEDLLLDGHVGLRDTTTYYWKVRAVDDYGAYSESSISSFTTDNPNNPEGLLNVTTIDALDSTFSLEGATLIPPANVETQVFSEQNEHNVMLPAGIQEIQVQLPGYQDVTLSPTIVEADTLPIEVPLVPAASFSFAGGVLRIPAVKLSSTEAYDVNLQQVGGGLTFSFAGAVPVTLHPEAQSATFSFSSGLLDIPAVDVEGLGRFYVTLRMQSGSGLVFALENAQPQ